MRGLLVTAAAAAALAAPLPAAAQAPSGELLYQRDCLWCHGAEGEGTPRGPSLEETGAAGAHFWLSTGRMPIPEPREAERAPPAYEGDELEALVEYVAGLGQGPAVPDVDLEQADFARGERLYRRHCAACHGFAGSGGALAYGRTSPALDQATAVQTVEAMLVGPGRMPVFPPPLVSEDEARDIAAYVQHLRAPVARGGHRLGEIGPVVEALVAALAGLGLLVLIRWGIGPGE